MDPSPRYKDAVNALSEFSLAGIAEACRGMLPVEFRNRPWIAAYPTQNFTEIFTTEDQLNGYAASYTSWHVAKLQLVFEEAHKAGAFASSRISVVDWGCGQGLATLCLLEYLKGKCLSNCSVGEVVLIEPSEVALARAQYVVGLLLPNATVRVVKSRLDDLTDSDVQLSGTSQIVHIFSNIIDVKGVSLKSIAEHLGVNRKARNYVLCVSPFYPHMELRFDTLLKYFSPPPESQARGKKTDKSSHSDYTYFYQTFVLPATEADPIVRYEFFAPVRYCAGYALECVFDSIPADDQRLFVASKFEVQTTFEFGVDAAEDMNPLLAVLSNIVCRGVPTLCSPRIEECFREAFACSVREEQYGGRSWRSLLTEEERTQVCACLKSLVMPDDDRLAQLVYTPLAIGRFQKVLIEALATGRLDFAADRWRFLVVERDVPFARIALVDFLESCRHLVALASEKDLLRIPEIDLQVVPAARFADSPLAQPESPLDVPEGGFDLVVEYSSTPQGMEFSPEGYPARNGCFFRISTCPKETGAVRRIIRTSDQVSYRELCRKNASGLYEIFPEETAHLRYFLNLVFRKDDFRDGQIPILSRALSNRSVIGLLPTGGGKSLTYQLAAMLQPGVTLVVDPLISLMSDQHDGLRRLRIDSCTYINSRVDDASARERKMEESRLQFVFVSPERLCILRFRNRLQNMALLGVHFAYGVIDEVHCVSEWGHDFRYSYLHLGRNLYQYVKPKQRTGNEHIALFGLTATASFDVLADVERDLSGEGSFPMDGDAIVRYENTNRLELQYRVVTVGSPAGVTNKWDIFGYKRDRVPLALRKSAGWMKELQEPDSLDRIRTRFIERENITDVARIAEIKAADLSAEIPGHWTPGDASQGAAIVFCPHRQGSLGVYDSQTATGVLTTIAGGLGLPLGSVSGYIGGDALAEQERFLSGKTSIMVATKAFGMGIDKPNVRFTSHLNYPGSLEGFVQEAGRAGRDRKMALATILYCRKKKPGAAALDPCGTYDFDVIEYFFGNNFKGADFEKRIIYHLMTKGVGLLSQNQDADEPLQAERASTVCGFMGTLEQIPVGDSFVYEISKTFRPGEAENRWLVTKCLDGAANVKALQHDLELNYGSYIMKAVYRMCCLRVIDDYTEDYSANTVRIVATHLASGEYFAALRRFLLRYYTEDRVKVEIDKAKDFKGDNEVQKCLGFLTEFVYSKIAMKKRRAMQDMALFCEQAANSKKTWLDVNEDLKDFIYYYFNSKFARAGYTAPNNEGFSLTDDTDYGRISSFDIVFKYVRVVDDDVAGMDGSPRDNIKHLLGAVRLIRRALTDVNPALMLLNAYCLFFLGEETQASEVLKQELRESFATAYLEFRGQMGVAEFLDNMRRFTEEMALRHVIGADDVERVKTWQMEQEVVYQSRWLGGFSRQYAQ